MWCSWSRENWRAERVGTRLDWVGQLRTSNSLTRINKYSVELYQTLQEETGCETGWNEVGIASAGGAGRYAAEWLENRAPTMDLWSVDVRRFLSRQNEQGYLRGRVTEVLGLHYQMAWPNREMETSRGLRKGALYERLRERGACFGSSMGWERPNWYAPNGVDPQVEYSFQRQNWAPSVAEEVNACRENVALFDQSTFAKFVLKGADAESILQRLCGNNVDVPTGRSVYTGLFNERGTFESDLTLLRVAEDEFYLVSSTAQQVHDYDWIARHVPGGAEAALTDVTEKYGVVSVMGPNARDLLSRVTDADLSNEAFPFGTAQTIEIGPASVRALRLTYVGELGWELHCRTEDQAVIFDALVDAGGGEELKLAGHYAINAMRLEKAYRAWGHDISGDETPLEAGLGFAIDWDTEFLGREALLRQKEEGVRKRLVTLVLEDPEANLWGSEPILLDREAVGYTTSGAYGPTLGRAVAMGYVKRPDGGAVTKKFIEESEFSILNDGTAYPARAHLKAPFDPRREKILQ